MPSARSKSSIVASLVLAVLGTFFPIAMDGRVNTSAAHGAESGGCCSTASTSCTCCCSYKGECSDDTSRSGTPSLSSECCGGGERTPVSTSSPVRLLVAPNAPVRAYLPRVRTWSPGDASRPDDAGREPPAPVPRAVDVARAA